MTTMTTMINATVTVIVYQVFASGCHSRVPNSFTPVFIHTVLAIYMINEVVFVNDVQTSNVTFVNDSVEIKKASNVMFSLDVVVYFTQMN